MNKSIQKTFARKIRVTHRYLWKDISKGLPLFVNLIHLCGRGGKGIFTGKSLGGGKTSLCFISETLRLYHSFSPKNRFIVDFLVWSESSFSFLLNVHHPLFNREKTNMTSLLVLLEGHSFRLGRRGVGVWNPNPLEEFSCKFFFQKHV